MKKKWISLMTSVMMFATILANPAIGAAAEKQSEAKDVQIKTVTSVEPTKAKEEKPEPSKASKATAQAASSKDIAVSEGVTGGNIYFDEATGTITGCDESVTGVVISSVINNVSVETIGESAFLGCSALTKVKLPDSVTVIEGYAFSECIKLEEVILPKNLENLKGRSFYNCKALGSIEIPKSLQKSGTAGGYQVGPFAGCAKLKDVCFEEGTKRIVENLFYDCDGIENVTIPEGVTEIGTSAFGNCVNLISVRYPLSLQKIGESAFVKCTGLASLELPEKLETIGESAFLGCSALTKVKLPDSVTVIEGYAFSECIKLEEVILPKNLENLKGRSFYNCKALGSIEIPKSLQKSGTAGGYQVGPFAGCAKLKDVCFEEGTKRIVENLFYDCDGIENVTIPEGVTEIGTSAFGNCINLSNVTYPSTLQIIGDSAFFKCVGLGEVAIPEKVAKIGSSAFNNCTKLTKAEIPNSVKSIGYQAFYRCPDIVIYCAANSYACIYAMDNNLEVVLTDSKFDTSNSILNYDATYYETNFSSTTINNGYIPLSLGYAIKNNKFVSLSNMKVVIKIPATAEIVSQTLTVDGELCTDYTENQGVITIPVTKRTGKIRLSVRPTDATSMRSYAKFNFTKNGVADSEVIGVINDEIPVLSLEANEITDSKDIVFKGVSSTAEDIKIYLDDEYKTSVVANKAGNYKGAVEIKAPSENKRYMLKAISENSSGERIEATTEIKYQKNAAVLTDFKMYYRNECYDLNADGARPNVTFVPGNQFTFETKFSNPQEIDNVHIVSERNNIKQRMKAIWDAKSNSFIAAGFFDNGNKNYVPGELSVEYQEKKKTSPIKVGDIVDVTSEEYTKPLSGLIKNSDVNVITNNSNVYEAELNLSDPDKGLNNVKLKLNVEKINTAARSIIGDALSGYETIKKYVQEDENGRPYILTIGSSPGKMIIFADDVLNNKTIKYVIEELTGDGFETVNKYLTGIGIAADTISAWYEYGDIQNQIEKSNMTIGEKQEATRKNKELRDDKIKFSVLVAGLTYVGTMALGPAGLGLGLLVGAIGMTSDFFWDARMAGILSGGRSRLNIQWAIDPSGYVYEGVTDNRIRDVKVTAYYKENEKSNTIKWDASEYDQINPLITAEDGTYAWDVPEGLWQVKYEKEGYQTTYSEWLPVPPPQTEVNIGMVSKIKPVVESAAVFDDHAQITFSQYMDPNTVTAITIKDPKGKNVPYTLEYDENQKNMDGKVFAKSYKLKFGMLYSVDKDGAYQIVVNNAVKNYAGNAIDACSLSKKYEKERSLVLPQKATVIYGGTSECSVELINAVGTETFECVTGLNDIAQVGSVSKINESGSAEITLIGNMIGETNLTISVPGTNLKATLPIEVKMSEESIDQLPAIEDLKVTLKAKDTALLEWSKDETFAGYEVYRAAAEQGTYNQIDSTKAPSYQDQPAKSGTYYYKVRGYKIADGKKLYGGYSGIAGTSVTIEQPQPPENSVTPTKPAKGNQTISGADTFTKAYGSKPFTLNAAASGGGQLSYQSSNPKIATVSSTGKVTIKNTGKVQITITAAATANYNAAAKTVTITVNPKKAAGLKAKAGKKRMTVSWKKDTKASGYQITYAQNKKFKKGKKNVIISKNKTTKKTIKKLKAKKTYYVKVRAYKKAGSQKLYGAYSGAKKVKVK